MSLTGAIRVGLQCKEVLFVDLINNYVGGSIQQYGVRIDCSQQNAMSTEGENRLR